METMSKESAVQALFERLHWGYAQRDDRQIADTIVNRREVDEVHNLSEGGMLDGFMAFLKECEFMNYLATMDVKDCKRLIIPVLSLMLTYIAKTIYNVDSVYALPAILFSDESVMKVLGFNARLLEDGLTHRSKEKRSSEKDQPKPFCPQMLANFMGNINVREAERFFNSAIQCLARFGVFQRELTVVIDGTDIETTEKCKGAGMRTKTDEVKGKPITYQAFGFKAVVLYDLASQLPIAVKVGKIHRHDSKFTHSLVQQGQDNLKGASKITKILADRGFIDGRLMWRLNRDGITFVCPAKKNMNVYTDAQALASHDEGPVQTRKRQVAHGHGKNKTIEVLETEAIGISGLTSWDQYNDPSLAVSQNKKDYTPFPINAVVVRKWDNEDFGPGGKVIYLTNQSVTKPLSVFDDYDGRSLIENTLFREGKQAWSLEAIPKKTQRAATAHIFVTFAVVALTTAFRTWSELEEEQDDLISPLADEVIGARRWRRELLRKNQDRVIVFSDGYYGIFHISEFTVLTGFKVRKIPPELGSIHDIYQRYGLKPPEN